MKRKSGVTDKTYSLKKYLILMWTITATLIVGGFLFVGIHMVIRYKSSMEETSRTTVRNYADSLNKDIRLMNDYVSSLSGGDVNYQMLKRDNLTEMQWMHAIYYLSNNFKILADNLGYFGGIFYYEEAKDTLCSSYSNYEFAGDEVRLNRALKDWLKVCCKEGNYDNIFFYENEYYLLHINNVKDKPVGFLINLNRYQIPEENSQIAYMDAKENILFSIGNPILTDNRLEEIAQIMQKEQKNAYFEMPAIIVTEALDMQDMTMMLICSEEELLFWKYGEFWIFVILVPIIAILGFLIVYGLLNKTLLQPVEYLVSRVVQMKSTDEIRDTRPQKNIREFLLIQEKMDKLLGEIQELEQEKYKKEMETNLIKLQYYQLQIDPHFYLNCLNIIDSMLDKGNSTAVHAMVQALSKHFRYVFRDFKNQVTIREELEEIQAFCNIYIFKGGLPILLQINASEEMREYLIPILCVQTFVENAIKHGRIENQILQIKITIDRIKDCGESYIRLQIADNGKGFAQERIQQLNNQVCDVIDHDKHIGIENIRYRVSLFYGERAKFFFYNQVSGGAVVDILLPEDKKDEHSHCG